MSTYETKQIFSENLCRLLSQSGKSQLDLALQLGVAPSSVSSWCNGEKMRCFVAMDQVVALRVLCAEHSDVHRANVLAVAPETPAKTSRFCTDGSACDCSESTSVLFENSILRHRARHD